MLEQVGTWSARQWVRAALILAIIATIIYITVRTFSVLVPFGLGLLLGYVILPLVDGLQRHLQAVLHGSRVSRILAILIVYAVGLALVALFLLYLVPVIVAQTQQLLANANEIVRNIENLLAGLQEFLVTRLPEQMQAFVREQLASLGQRLPAAVASSIGSAIAAIGSTLAVIVGFVIVPVWLIYVLYEAGPLGGGFLGLFPESVRPDVMNVGRIFDDVFGAYLRGQLIVAAIIGSLTGLGLSLLGVNFAALLGLITALGDLVPTVGPIIAAIPTVLIAGIERPILALWAVLVLLGVQQFEGAFIGPRIVGESVQLSPAIIIVLLVIAGELAGLIGLLVVVPLAAFLRDIVRYIYLRTSAEPVLPAEALARVRRARTGGRQRSRPTGSRG